MRLLTISDSDSYLKWAVALTAAAPVRWAVRHLMLDNVIAPSPAQVRGVLAEHPGRPVTRVGGLRLAHAVATAAPDALLIACTGPALEAVLDLLARSGQLGPRRPILLTGLPGISYPANDQAVHHRRVFDLMVLHSHRERAAYAAVTARIAGPRLALATLPFLSAAPAGERGGAEVVFAAQSLVPPRPEQRRAILAALAGVAEPLRPVVKVRARSGERQAHNEAAPYAELWRTMAQPRPIEFRAGSMAAALRSAAGFATVSSTAVLEAVAAGVPALVLDEFGVSAAMINEVFQGSGLLGGLARLTAGDFAHPRREWLRDNYFHAAEDNDWVVLVEQLLERRRAGVLPEIGGRSPDSWATRARRQARVLPPGWVWSGLRRLRSGSPRSGR